MDGGGFASCRTAIDPVAREATLGFSDDTVALRLEVTGDGQRYKVGLREKDGFKEPTWQAEFDTKAGERTVVELPLDKDTWYGAIGGRPAAAVGQLPDWSQLRGIGVILSSMDVHGKPADPTHFRGSGPFEITLHSIEMLNRDSRV